MEQERTIENQQEILGQEDGLRQLHDYFYDRLPFPDIKPFEITSAASYIVKVGKNLQGGKIEFYLIPDHQKHVLGGGRLIVSAHQDENEQYQWLNVSPDEKDSQAKSYRIDKENYDIFSRRWQNLEEQLFQDYLAGEGIEPEDLKDIEIVSSSGTTHLFGLDDSQVQIHFARVKKGTELILKAKCDPRGYTWFECYTKENGEEKFIGLRRFVKGSPQISDWEGPDFQALVDWIHGKIPIDQAGALHVTLSEFPAYKIKLRERYELRLDLRSNSHFLPGEEILIKPQQDDMYRWIEVQNLSRKSQDGADGNVVKYRLLDGEDPRLSASWPGPERQRIIDYLDGIVDDAHFIDFDLMVTKSATLSLITYHDKQVGLFVNSEILQHQGKVRISPFQKDGSLWLRTSNPQNPEIFEEFIFDKERLSFKKMRNGVAIRKPHGYWTEENLEKEAFEFYLKHGNLSARLLMKNGRGDVYKAAKRYSGGITALREKIKSTIDQIGTEPSLDLNQQMDSLLSDLESTPIR